MTGRLITLALALTALVAQPALAGDGDTTTPIKHFLMLMQENHTFDNYFAGYPGADSPPADVCMPNDPTKPAAGCTKREWVGETAVLDLGHGLEEFDYQYNGGKLNGFVDAFLNHGERAAEAKPMGYYDDRDLPYYWNIADNYVLFDRFFSSAKAGSVWNHMYWVTGTPGDTTDRDRLGKPRESIPDAGFSDAIPTIFDRLQEAGISWKFYVQNYDPTVTWFNKAERAGDKGSQPIWVPLLAYKRYTDDPELARHIVDIDELYVDLQNGTLPAVAYIAPAGSSEHPPGRVQAGETFVRTIANELMRSPHWKDSAFLWTYDDWGGWYDHVKPPQKDEFGYGFRVPALLVSPLAKHGQVDHTELDFTSALKFIEENWGVAPLGTRDRAANSFVSAFDFSQVVKDPVFLTRERVLPPRPVLRTAIVYWAYGSALALPAIIVAIGTLLAVRGRRDREEAIA